MWKYTSWNKIIKVVVSVITVIFAILILAAIVGQPTESTDKQKVKNNEIDKKDELSTEPDNATETEKVTEIENDDLLTNGEWALYEPYMFGVELSDFDGDNYKSGVYSFTTSGSKNEAGKIAAIYDIYVTDVEYASSADTVANEDSICSAGGLANLECEITLEKGNYVYVIPTENISGSSGMLSIDIKD